MCCCKQGAAVNNTNKKVIFKNCAPFTNCVSKINNTQVNDPQDINILMPMYSLIEYSDAYSKTSGILQLYYRDGPALDNKNGIIDFCSNNNDSISFQFKQQITTQTGNGSTQVVEIMIKFKIMYHSC